MLTKRQKQTLDYIEGYIDRTGGVAPSYAEVAAAMGLKSKANVHAFVDKLVARGAVRRVGRAGSWRGLEILRKRNVPLDVYTRDNALLLMFNAETGKVDALLPPAGTNRPSA
jgi:SOS-response transcriptional repressor LexA